MKNPEQIADEQMRAFTIRHDEDVEECSAEYIREQIIAAIEADRAQRSETSEYVVGDPDPTPDLLDEPGCGAKYGLFTCTWRREHPGRPHVAGTGELIAAVWS